MHVNWIKEQEKEEETKQEAKMVIFDSNPLWSNADFIVKQI